MLGFQSRDFLRESGRVELLPVAPHAGVSEVVHSNGPGSLTFQDPVDGFPDGRVFRQSSRRELRRTNGGLNHSIILGGASVMLAEDRVVFVEMVLRDKKTNRMLPGPDGTLYVVDMYRGIVQEQIYWTDFLRDYIKATVGFEKLGEATGAPPKSLIRMFGPRGNPQAKNLFSVLGYLQKRAGFEMRVTLGR